MVSNQNHATSLGIQTIKTKENIMKRCPTCDKTFDDNLKFCQADGTPLVDDEPADPYATMVGNRADFQIPPREEPKVPEVPKAAEPPKAVEPPRVPDVATPAPKPVDLQAADKEDILEVSKADDFDPMKTMVAGKDTSASVKVDPKDLPKPETKDSTPPKSPEPPKFDSPDVAAPDLIGAPGEAEKGKESGELEIADTPPPSPFDSKSGGDAASAPIPSPFDHSLPPGYAPPSTPPFDPSEPVKAEKVGSVKKGVKKPEPIIATSPNDWAPPPAPIKESSIDTGGDSPAVDAAAEGKNKTLAIVSLVCGVLSMTICCGIGILLGPAGIITGFMARRKINENPNQYDGATFALIGMITGGIGVFVFIGLIIVQVFFGALANF